MSGYGRGTFCGSASAGVAQGFMVTIPGGVCVCYLHYTCMLLFAEISTRAWVSGDGTETYQGIIISRFSLITSADQSVLSDSGAV